jgi:hypothetical protein
MLTARFLILVEAGNIFARIVCGQRSYDSIIANISVPTAGLNGTRESFVLKGDQGSKRLQTPIKRGKEKRNGWLGEVARENISTCSKYYWK